MKTENKLQLLNNKIYHSNMWAIFTYSVLSLGFLSISLIYNVLWDLTLIVILVISGYSIGRRLHIGIGFLANIIVKIGFGIGVIGCIMWLVLAIGIGSKSIYCLILIVPILEWGFKLAQNIDSRDELQDDAIRLKNILIKNAPIVFVMGIYLLFCIVYAAAPISAFDAGTAHLPIITYATENGRWYTNIIESLSYADAMLLQHSLSVIFTSLNAVKALQFFPLLIHFLIAIILCIIGKMLYKDVNVFVILAVYLTVPVFFEKATSLSIDMFAVFYWLLALLFVINLNEKTIFGHLSIICFLCGCSIFAKYTTVFFVFVTGLIVIGLVLYKECKTKNYKKIVIRFIKGAIALFAPAGIPALYIWYKVGNPFFPFYNNVFKSPYYPIENYVDPYSDAGRKLGLNWNSLMQLVFHTNNNTETFNGALGLYLLLVLIVPIGILFLKDKKILIWTIATCVMYQISCFFSYNTRYMFGALILIIPIIVISLSALGKCVGMKCASIILGFACIILVGFNFYIMHEHIIIPWRLQVNEEVTEYSNREILKAIPEGKRVFALNDYMKGDYKGYFSSDSWHISYIIIEIDDERMDFDSYITSFDYVLYNKKADVPNHGHIFNEGIHDLIKTAGSEESYLEVYLENDNYILYEIKDNANVMLERTYESINTSIEKPFIEGMNVRQCDSKYKVTTSITNPYDNEIQMRWQINWVDSKNTLLNTSVVFFDVMPGTNIYSTEEVESDNQAVMAYLSIFPSTNETVEVNEIKVESKEDVIDEQEKLLYERTMLNDSSVIENRSHTQVIEPIK